MKLEGARSERLKQRWSEKYNANNPFTLSKLLANIANWASRRYVFS